MSLAPAQPGQQRAPPGAATGQTSHGFATTIATTVAAAIVATIASSIAATFAMAGRGRTNK